MGYSVFAQKRRRFLPVPYSELSSPVNPAFDTIHVRAIRALYQWRSEIEEKRPPAKEEYRRPKETSSVSINGTEAWERAKLTCWKKRGLLREDGSLRCQPVKPPLSTRKLRLLFPGLELEDARAIRERMSGCG